MGAMLNVTCPACRQGFEVPAIMAGRRGPCPHCASPVQIPAGGGEASPTTAPQPSARPQVGSSPVYGVPSIFGGAGAPGSASAPGPGYVPYQPGPGYVPYQPPQGAGPYQAGPGADAWGKSPGGAPWAGKLFPNADGTASGSGSPISPAQVIGVAIAIIAGVVSWFVVRGMMGGSSGPVAGNPRPAPITPPPKPADGKFPDFKRDPDVGKVDPFLKESRPYVPPRTPRPRGTVAAGAPRYFLHVRDIEDSGFADGEAMYTVREHEVMEGQCAFGSRFEPLPPAPLDLPRSATPTSPQVLMTKGRDKSVWNPRPGRPYLPAHVLDAGRQLHDRLEAEWRRGAVSVSPATVELGAAVTGWMARKWAGVVEHAIDTDLALRDASLAVLALGINDPLMHFGLVSAESAFRRDDTRQHPLLTTPQFFMDHLVPRLRHDPELMRTVVPMLAGKPHADSGSLDHRFLTWGNAEWSRHQARLPADGGWMLPATRRLLHWKGGWLYPDSFGGGSGDDATVIPGLAKPKPANDADRLARAAFQTARISSIRLAGITPHSPGQYRWGPLHENRRKEMRDVLLEILGWYDAAKYAPGGDGYEPDLFLPMYLLADVLANGAGAKLPAAEWVKRPEIARDPLTVRALTIHAALTPGAKCPVALADDAAEYEIEAVIEFHLLRTIEPPGEQYVPKRLTDEAFAAMQTAVAHWTKRVPHDRKLRTRLVFLAWQAGRLKQVADEVRFLGRAPRLSGTFETPANWEAAAREAGVTLP